MVRYSPGVDLWGEPLAPLRRIQEEINRAFGEQRWAPSAEFPPINIWRGPEGIIVTAEIPGVSLNAVDLIVHQNTFTIKGRREPEAKEPEASFHRRERTFGPFSRTIALPFNVDPDQVKATAQNGILTVELPRPESDKPRKIKVSQS
jgi:HSP20 family protein